jgi:tRNA pseudouridine38-40 synthase
MVGDGHFKVDDVQRILEAKDRKQAGVTAPSEGLYLSKVWY